jgi:hypothetical protein
MYAKIVEPKNDKGWTLQFFECETCMGSGSIHVFEKTIK